MPVKKPVLPREYEGSAMNLAKAILRTKGEQIDTQLLSAMVIGEHLERIGDKLMDIENLCVAVAGPGLKHPLGAAMDSVAGSLDELQRKVDELADNAFSIGEAIAGLGQSHDPK